MPQINLTVNDERGIIAGMTTIDFDESLPASQITSASSLTLNLPRSPKLFYRHGWQSWTLATWLDPSKPALPIRAPEFRAKDEDAPYAFAKNHVSAWIGAVEMGSNEILLLGALGLGGRVELDGASLRGFYESGEGHWLVARGLEDAVFNQYTNLLAEMFGKTRYEKAPRVWCSWYSLYRWIGEPVILKVLKELDDLPFDVFQLDDGWQIAHGDWEPNKKFPSGMKEIADKISATGRIPGIWLAPLMVVPWSQLAKEHPDWLLRDEDGKPVTAGITWGGNPLALDSSHPAVLDWLDKLIRKVRSWGYGYLKLDFLYTGALVGKRHKDVPREAAYRNTLKVIREAAGDAYILTCGAPIIPSLGLCDGMRVGPDVTPYWLNKPHSVWLNNPNNPSTQNAIRTSLHRLWLNPIVNTDPDVAYFRSRHNAMTNEQKRFLQDLGMISRFKATSDLPQWLNSQERESLRQFLETDSRVKKTGRCQYQIDDRLVDFSSVMLIPDTKNVAIPFAKNAGFIQMAIHEVLPAVLESRKK
ncbi:MAG: alpha-galactosidase [Chloroflexi bacterium]|nr:alpha-galactosidase [Chloroflexota bacterium]